MPKDCDKVEELIKEKGCTGKRVSKELIESRITEVDYQTVVIAGQKMMYCGIKMDNGFVAVGKPATCIDPANWRDEIGQKISYDNSFEELWKLEAYRLMSEGLEPETIAKVCHQINKAYCEALGDHSQPDWSEAPEWQKESAIAGVKFHQANPEAGADASHNSWMAQKEADGWVYGEEKNPGKKEHPCMVPFESLPVEQKAKDYLFKAIVHELS